MQNTSALPNSFSTSFCPRFSSADDSFTFFAYLPSKSNYKIMWTGVHEMVLFYVNPAPRSQATIANSLPTGWT